MVQRSFENKRDLLFELVKIRFKLKYDNSLMGFFWVLTKPLLSFAVFYLVLTAFKNEKYESLYAISLLLGIIIHNSFQESVMMGMNSLSDFVVIFLKISFPKEIAISSSIIMSTINFIINFLVFVIIFFILGYQLKFTGFIYFIYLSLLLFMISLSLSFFLSIISIQLKDLYFAIELFMQVSFWTSGAIFLDINLTDSPLRYIFHVHPIGLIIDSARKALIYNEISNLYSILFVTLLTSITFVLGFFFFKKRVNRVAEFF